VEALLRLECKSCAVPGVNQMAPETTMDKDMKKKKKQIGISHTRVGIGHGRQLAGQVEGEQ
jgi:hypothetical protein